MLSNKSLKAAAIIAEDADALYQSSPSAAAPAGGAGGSLGRESDQAKQGGPVPHYKTEGYVWDELGEALRSTVWRGRFKFVKELLDIGADANYRTVYCGWRPIHYAAWNNFGSIITVLLEAGANIDARTEYGETPLHLAALKASNDAIRISMSRVCVCKNDVRVRLQVIAVLVPVVWSI